ncbi:serine/threonine protein kinase [Minicystis rosea]|nr:serine/threonine protein kinase [Minicystis rosea]
MIGQTLGNKYRIERILGSGGMGSVYAAEDVGSGQRVAVKVIHGNLPGDSTQLLQRFEREARAAGSIGTEHICRCLDAGTDPESGHPFMVLEYLVGEDLQHLLQRLGPLPPELALRIVAQACLGLSAAHGAGVVHRDIKPANIFLAETEDGRRTVKLLDFGVAKIKRDPTDMHGDTAGLTRTGSLLGSPLYMSPEQARSVKNVDHRSDLWSMGIVLYQAVAGRTPYDHVSGLGDLILSLCSDLPPPVQQFAPWVEPRIASVIDRALRLDLSERFASAAEMLEAIVALLPDGTDIHADMLVPLDAATRADIASTYFRSLGRKSTGRESVADTQAAPESPSVPPPPAPATISRPPQTTQTAIATTGAGLESTQPGQRSPGGRPASVVAIALACVLAGGGGVYALTRSAPVVTVSPQAATTTALPQPTTQPTVTATTVPTVTPSASATSAPTAAESAAPVPTATADASAKPAASAPKPLVVPAKKGTSPAVPPMDHRSYGDRK